MTLSARAAGSAARGSARPERMSRPPAVRNVERRLRRLYGQPRHHNKRDPLSELVFILLSTQTREAEYRRTFSALWTAYRSWNRVRQAEPETLIRLIRFGGFARRKVSLLLQLLERVHRDHGTTSLRSLRTASTTEALAYLTSLPGVGPKTARCVAMYALKRPVLAVDTHVWRVAKRLGWIAGGKHPDTRRSAELEASIPPGLRYSLHVTLVAHGRRVCRARAACNACPLRDICPRIGVNAEPELRASSPPGPGVSRMVSGHLEIAGRHRRQRLRIGHSGASGRYQTQGLPEWAQPEELVADLPSEDLCEE